MTTDFYLIRNDQGDIVRVGLDEAAMRTSPDYHDRWLIGVIDTLRSQNSALEARVQVLEARFGIGAVPSVIALKAEETP